MRLTALELDNYGCFEAARLRFDPRPGSLNLVVGPNGAGKTVLRGAFRDLLFGIPGQSPMAFRFGYSGMRVLARGVDAAGARFAIVRRKGNGNTLVDGSGNNLDPMILRRLIGDADEPLLERLFALDTLLLRRGAETMLASGGDLAEALFAAGSGIAGLRRVRRHFETLRDDLAPARRAGARPLYRGLEELTAARNALNRATTRPQTWHELSGKREFVRDRKASLAAEQAYGQAEIERLQRLKRVRPWLEQWDTARRQLADAAAAPALPADIEERWQAAKHAAAIAEHRLAAEDERVRALTRRVAGEAPDRQLLGARSRIEELHRTEVGIAAYHRDLPRREAERRQTQERLAALLADLGGDDAGGVMISATGPQIAAARELIKRQLVLQQNLQSAEAKIADHAREIDATEAALAAAAAPQDTTRLAALVEDSQRHGDPGRRLAELAAASERQEARLAAALARLPLWQRGLDELAALAPPGRAAIERAAETRDGAARALAGVERELARLAAERGETCRRLGRDRAGGPVPDGEAIATARSRRDLGWSLIRRSRFDGEALETAIADYAGADGLPAAFERAVAAADHLADRRDGESRRLARITEQQRSIEALDAAIADHKGQHQRAVAAQADAARQWAALTAGLCLGETTPCGDLHDFIATRAAVLEVRADRDCAQRAVAAETARQGAARERLARLLPEADCASFAETLEAARRALDRSAADRERCRQLQVQLDTYRRLHRKSLEESARAMRSLQHWQRDWQDCLAALSRPAGETPAAVEKAIELIEAAQRERGKFCDLDHRIAGMRQNIAEFTGSAAELGTALAPDLHDAPAAIVADTLYRQLAQHLEIETRRAALAAELREAELRQQQAALGRQDAAAALAALGEEIGGRCDDEIGQRMALARARRDAAKRLHEAEAKLAEIGEGWPIEALEREVATLPADEIEAELARLREADRRLGGEREIAAADEARLGEELRHLEAGEDAIAAEQRRQAAVALVARISGEALLYHAAGCLLQRAIERVRALGESGLVERIGAAFARLTAGAYAGVAVDEDDKGTPFLVAVTADRRAGKAVGELSEGECDQLYLAMRLVMVADYAEKAPPLPFIGDDLLQTFDDYGRTERALAALAELSHKVQVILFSHHRQLIDVARGLLGADALNVCELAA